jgi:hypothetical protein
VHKLNLHIKNEDLTGGPLPTFEHVTIDGVDLEKEKLQESRIDGKLFKEVTLNPKEALDIRVCRRELTYVPGTYNFVLAELTGGVTIHVDQLPPGFTAQVLFGPEFETVSLSSQGSHSVRNKLFLPGHCIEFRLERITKAKEAPL